MSPPVAQEAGRLGGSGEQGHIGLGHQRASVLPSRPCLPGGSTPEITRRSTERTERCSAAPTPETDTYTTPSISILRPLRAIPTTVGPEQHADSATPLSGVEAGISAIERRDSRHLKRILTPGPETAPDQGLERVPTLCCHGTATSEPADTHWRTQPGTLRPPWGPVVTTWPSPLRDPTSTSVMPTRWLTLALKAGSCPVPARS